MEVQSAERVIKSFIDDENKLTTDKFGFIKHLLFHNKDGSLECLSNFNYKYFEF